MRPEHAPDAQRAAPMENQQNATFERYGCSQTSEDFEVSSPLSEPFSLSSDSDRKAVRATLKDAISSW